MEKKSPEIDEIFEEVKRNARSDRKKLAEFRDSLLDFDNSEIAEGEPLAKIDLAKSVAEISAAITKANSQLIEMARIMMRRAAVANRKDSGIGENEREDMFDRIGDDSSTYDEEDDVEV